MLPGTSTLGFAIVVKFESTFPNDDEFRMIDADEARAALFQWAAWFHARHGFAGSQRASENLSSYGAIGRGFCGHLVVIENA